LNSITHGGKISIPLAGNAESSQVSLYKTEIRNYFQEFLNFVAETGLILFISTQYMQPQSRRLILMLMPSQMLEREIQQKN
jgi:hypothetical protein